MIFRMFLYDVVNDVVIISNKVNNYLYKASHYWLGTVIQKTSIEKSHEKHLNNDFHCFHTLKVIRTDSIKLGS